MLLSTDSHVDSYNFGIAVFEKYFLLGNSYCGSNCFSKLAKPSFSIVYMGNISFPIQYMTASVSLCHFLLFRLYFCVALIESMIDTCDLPSGVLLLAVVECCESALSFRNSSCFSGWCVFKWEIRFDVFPPRAATALQQIQHNAVSFFIAASYL